MSSVKKAVPAMKGLSYFITRAQVFQQYRSMMRGAIRLRSRDICMANDIAVRVRESFRQEAKDDFQVRQRLAFGVRQLTLLNALSDEVKPASPEQPTHVSRLRGPIHSGEKDAIAVSSDESEPPTWPWERC